jgi:beta-1,4-mannosyl-glycoprotein beta-1,4-N-acetylglucosaminyltransferase
MIIDSIIFFNELDILDVRLHELSPIVDKFIIVESLERHGSPEKKEAVIASNWERFKEFEHKIKYVVLPELQPRCDNRDASWPRENYHRNAIMPVALEICRSGNDLLMISDCDEIPRAMTVATRASILYDSPHALSQDLFYYNVNSYMGTWNGTVAGTIDQVNHRGGPQAMRNMRDSLPHLGEGGWHFSYFGGFDHVWTKLESFAHAQEDSARLVRCRDRQDIIRDMLSGADIYQRPGEGRKERRSEHDARLPEWMRRNMRPEHTEAGLS